MAVSIRDLGGPQAEKQFCSLQGVKVSEMTDEQIRQACSGPSARSTPDGYVLYDPGYKRDLYRYDSNWYLFAQVEIDISGVTVLAEIEVQYRQRVLGGTSKSWVISADVNQLSNEGGLTYQQSFEYYCGVNLPGDDPTCNEYAGDGADLDHDERVFNPGEQYQKYFGYTNNVTKFPMFKYVVAWSTGITQSFQFRGYDVCVRASTTRLCTNSGNGS